MLTSRQRILGRSQTGTHNLQNTTLKYEHCLDISGGTNCQGDMSLETDLPNIYNLYPVLYPNPHLPRQNLADSGMTKLMSPTTTIVTLYVKLIRKQWFPTPSLANIGNTNKRAIVVQLMPACVSL